MNPKPISFEFCSYRFIPQENRMLFEYRIAFENADDLSFVEEIILPENPELENIPKELLDNLIFDLHLMLGISYYKLYCPEKIILNKNISQEQSNFWNSVYQNGLGEFYYRNKLNPDSFPGFPFGNGNERQSHELTRKNRSLV